jgi:hypothetical protein
VTSLNGFLAAAPQSGSGTPEGAMDVITARKERDKLQDALLRRSGTPSIV